ncbi:MAG: sodium-dependent bicarbonate transport family permease [Pseudomonadota bacterium]
MDSMLTLAGQNLLTPMILSFALGGLAALLRSDLSVPEAAAKTMALYLLFAIGFKGGVAVSKSGIDGQVLAALAIGIALSFVLPIVAFGLLRVVSRLSAVEAAAVAAHYGSISIVTFATASGILALRGIEAEGYMVAVSAAMESPAIITALWLASRSGQGRRAEPGLWREILLNGSIVLLVGAFAIGMITGPEGMAKVEAFVVAPWQGVLCLFLLDMGLVAGRGLRGARGIIGAGLVAFGVVMPMVGAAAGLGAALLLGLSLGGTVLMMVLAASASYIAVPAAMRVALPEANPSVALTLSLGITFPFNLVFGIPAYIAVAEAILGG